jgi:hypothetical protein
MLGRQLEVIARRQRSIVQLNSIDSLSTDKDFAVEPSKACAEALAPTTLLGEVPRGSS